MHTLPHSTSTLRLERIPSQCAPARIAKELGDAKAYMAIFEANRDQLKDPDKIQPGQVVKIPQVGVPR